MPLTYMQCRENKCTPERIMNKERAVYMQTLKRKCSLAAKNPSKQAIQAYSACAEKHYNGSRLKPMDDNQAKCSKKNCDHLIRFGGGKYAKEIQTRRSGQRTRRRRGGTHSRFSQQSSRYSSGPRGKTLIDSAIANSRASRQSRSFAEKNELDLDAAQKQLVNDLAEQVVELTPSKGKHRYFVIGQYLNWWLLTEKEMQEIDTTLPEGDEKTRFEQCRDRVNPTLKKLLYYALIMTVIASIISKGHKPNR